MHPNVIQIHSWVHGTTHLTQLFMVSGFWVCQLLCKLWEEQCVRSQPCLASIVCFVLINICSFFSRTIDNISEHISVHFPTAFVQADVDSGHRDVAMIVSSPTALSLNPNDNRYGTVIGGGGGGTFALRNLYGLDPMHACVIVLRDVGGVWTPIGGPVPFGNPGTNYSAKYTTMKAGHTQFAPIRLFPPHGPLFRSVSVIKSIRLYSPDGNRKWLLAIVCHYCM
jgi:hypothetical protein